MLKIIGTSLLCCLAACSGPQISNVKGYEGEAKASNEVIHIRSNSPYLFLDSYNKIAGRFYPMIAGPAIYSGFDLSLPPGEHVITIHYSEGNLEQQAASYHKEIHISGTGGDVFGISVVRYKDTSIAGSKNGHSVEFKVTKNESPVTSFSGNNRPTPVQIK